MRRQFIFLFAAAISTLGKNAPALSQAAAVPSDAQRCVDESNNRNPDFAIGFCDRALKNLDQLPLNVRVTLLNSRAYAYNQKSDYDRAIADYTAASKADPLDLVAFHGLGEAFRLKGDYSSAVANYTEAIRLGGKDPSTFRGRGLAYAAMKDESDNAIQDFNTALKLNPNYASVYYNRGTVYSDKGDIPRAIQDFDQAIRLDPADPTPWSLRCRNRALINQLQEAISDCNESLRLAPGDPYTLANRAFVYAKMNRREEAVMDYRKALTLNPDDDLRRTISLALIELRKPK